MALQKLSAQDPYEFRVPIYTQVRGALYLSRLFIIKIVTDNCLLWSVGDGGYHYPHLRLHPRITLVAREQRQDRQGSKNPNSMQW